MQELPDYMLVGRRVLSPEDLDDLPKPNTDFLAARRVIPVNVLDWLLVVLVLAYALSGYWQGFVTGAFATVGLLPAGCSASGWRRSRSATRTRRCWSRSARCSS